MAITKEQLFRFLYDEATNNWASNYEKTVTSFMKGSIQRKEEIAKTIIEESSRNTDGDDRNTDDEWAGIFGKNREEAAESS